MGFTRVFLVLQLPKFLVKKLREQRSWKIEKMGLSLVF
jgi:hypothetical protein